MSQFGLPSPMQPSYAINSYQTMAQTQRTPGLPAPDFITRPEQHAPGLQLPPIQSLPPNQSQYDMLDRPVQLPPLQIPQYGTNSTTRSTPLRSIPVAHLLSSNPPSPSKPAATSPAQQTSHWHTQPTSYIASPTEHQMQPLSYQQALPHRLDHARIAYRQAPSESSPFQAPPYTRARPSAQVSYHARAESSDQRPFSPAVSIFSSPSYTHSEASPRSSVGPSSQTSQKPRRSQAPPFDFILSIRQQPAAARACGFGERDRRVIDPPPILELKITDRATGAPEQDGSAMLALHCTLLNPDGHDDETELPPAHPDMPSTRRLMGTLVASPYQAKDENGVAGTFFAFPDLSCRSPGKYRLRFKLLRIDPMNNTPGAISPCVASIVTDVFSVFTAKDFPGMSASSGLLKALRRQGLNVGVKKGSEARKGKGKTNKANGLGTSSDEAEDHSDLSSDETSSRMMARRKGKRRRQA